jgi:VIT1/CCC1 family predicted Fe2+/Mn2+ transporter
VRILAQNDELFVNAMMIEELEISPETEEQKPVKNGLASFGSFLIFGTIPVLPFIVYIIGFSLCEAPCHNGWISRYNPLYISIGVTAIGIGILGVLKAKVTGNKMWVSLAQSFGGGVLSVAFGGGLAYAIYYATDTSV